MSNSGYPTTPLAQHGYTPYSNPDMPYPLAVSTGQTPAQHSLYSENDPSSTGLDHVSGTSNAADPKTRLRKACDSCSTRKVKVSWNASLETCLEDWSCITGDPKLTRHLRLDSAMNMALRVEPVPPSRFRAPSTAQAVVGDLPINTLRPSRNADSMTLLPARASPRLARQPMPPRLLRPLPSTKFCRASPSVRSIFYSCSSTTTSPISIR